VQRLFGPALAAIAAVMVMGCQQQWVAPYSPDLQKRASDMLTDVAVWERHMREAAGTVAADPRYPEVQAKLQTWSGELEGMATIELGIDPGSTVCDAFLKSLGDRLEPGLTRMLPTGVTGASSVRKLQITTRCESLPGIFARMSKEVGKNIPDELQHQCRLPWLPDAYFLALSESRAAAGAPGSPRPAASPMAAKARSEAAKARPPAPGEEADIKLKCSSLFVPVTDGAGQRSSHGDALGPLIIQLESIIYREGRQAPPAGK
jgi:hypothetical protein